VMDGAGMTVGGFYAHFPSKQSLVTEAVGSALKESRGPLTAGLEDALPEAWIEAVVCRYLSRTHRDNPDTGCPLPAIVAEVAKSETSVREAFAEGIEMLAEGLTSKYSDFGAHQPGEEALATISLMVGGLALSRALSGTPQSDEVLKSCRDHLRRCLEA